MNRLVWLDNKYKLYSFISFKNIELLHGQLSIYEIDDSQHFCMISDTLLSLPNYNQVGFQPIYLISYKNVIQSHFKIYIDQLDQGNFSFCRRDVTKRPQVSIFSFDFRQLGLRCENEEHLSMKIQFFSKKNSTFFGIQWPKLFQQLFRIFVCWKYRA